MFIATTIRACGGSGNAPPPVSLEKTCAFWLTEGA